MENLVITEFVKSNLLSAVKWLKFLAVASTVGVSIGILAILFAIVSGVPAQNRILLFVYIPVCAIYIYPIVKSFNIVNYTRRALNYTSQPDLEEASANVKSVLKFFGIMLIVMLSIYALVLMFVIGLAAFGYR